jgi:G3E family GTPase
MVLLIGFLGSGKTTLIRKLVPALKDAGCVPQVILNDYQNARVDAALLEEITAHVVPISGSCVCCGSREQLLESLETLPMISKGVVLLEANGTSDAVELVELLSLAPQARRFSAPLQISVVDAKRWQKRFWHNPLEREQIRTASWIYPTRREEIDAKRWESVQASVTEANPRAVWMDFEGLLQELQESVSETEKISERGSTEKAFADWDRESHAREQVHVGTYHFASLEFPLPSAVDRTAFERFQHAVPQGVERIKGLIAFTDNPEVFHSYQWVGDPPQGLLLPLKGTPKNRPVLVFIGSGLPRVQLSLLVDGLRPLPI